MKKRNSSGIQMNIWCMCGKAYFVCKLIHYRYYTHDLMFHFQGSLEFFPIVQEESASARNHIGNVYLFSRMGILPLYSLIGKL